MKILIDMNLSPRWVQVFVNAGIEASHWSRLGNVDTPDEEIMRFAAQNNWVVFTHDLDSGDILAVTHGQKPSVIQLRSQDVSPQSLGPTVLVGVTQMASELEAGVLMTIDPQRTRIRILPLVFRE